jgi:transcriptional regulator with XRE-family HTH domain
MGNASVIFDPAPLKIAKAAKGRGWGIVKIAQRAGIHASTVSRILTGKCPNSPALADVCAVLGVPVEACFRPANLVTHFDATGQCSDPPAPSASRSTNRPRRRSAERRSTEKGAA